MSDNRSRHDRLAVRLSLIISRLMAGESLSLKTLSDEFGVTERTLQRDFHQRLVHLDLEYRNGRYSLRRQSSPGAIPEMLSFIQNTGIARILPLRNGRLITCLTDNQEPSPCLIWLPAPDITATFPECFSQLILAIRQCIHITLMNSAGGKASDLFGELTGIAVLLTMLPYFYSCVDLIRFEGVNIRNFVSLICSVLGCVFCFIALMGASSFELAGTFIVSLIILMFYARKMHERQSHSMDNHTASNAH